MRVWSLSTARTWNVIGHTRLITSVGFTGDGKHITSTSHHDSIRVWSIFGKHQQVFNTPGPAAVSKDGQHIAFCVDDRTLRVRSVFGGHERNFHSDSDIRFVEFSDDGQWIKFGGWSYRTILSINTGEKAESNTIAFNNRVRTRLIYKSGND